MPVIAVFANLLLENDFRKIAAFIATFTEGVSYCCFRKTFSHNLFQNVLLANFISTCVNLLQNLFFAHFLLIEGYGKCALRKKLVIAPFVE